MLTQDEKTEILSIFPDADLEIVDSLLYSNGWSGYDACAYIIIFIGIDGSTQCCWASDDCMNSDPEWNIFRPYEVTDEEAVQLVAEMEEAIENFTC